MMKKAHNASNQTFQFAGFWRRVGAFALDYIVISAYLILLTGVGIAVNQMIPGGMMALFGSPIIAEISGFLMITLPVSLYFALFESSAWQATWGKRRLGLQVVHSDGTRLSRAQALGRTALKFIPWELAHACVWQVSFSEGEPSTIVMAGFIVVWVLVGANVVSLLMSGTRQALYDRLAGVYVVRRQTS